jgi:hypothetical protein
MKQKGLFIITVFCALQGKAQLPSERPVSSLYSEEAKQKLNKMKGIAGSTTQLPSVVPLSKQAVFAQRNKPILQNSVQGKPAALQLPSNSKTLRPPVRPQKRADSNN